MSYGCGRETSGAKRSKWLTSLSTELAPVVFTASLIRFRRLASTFFSLFYLWLVCHLSWACLTAYISAVIAVSNCTLVTLKAHREIFRGPGLSFHSEYCDIKGGLTYTLCLHYSSIH